MPGKLLFMRFVPRDWLGDPRVRDLYDTAKAIWIDLLCILFDEAADTGSSARTLTRWARNLGRDEETVLAAFREIQEVGTADLSPRLDDAVESATVITIASRRMARDAHRRERSRERKSRSRDSGHADVTPHVSEGKSQESRSCHADVTPHVTRMSQHRHGAEAPEAPEKKRVIPSIGPLPTAEPPDLDRTSNHPDQTCSRCTEGFCSDAGRCCSCHEGRARAQRIAKASQADREQQERARRAAMHRPREGSATRIGDALRSSASSVVQQRDVTRAAAHPARAGPHG